MTFYLRCMVLFLLLSVSLLHAQSLSDVRKSYEHGYASYQQGQYQEALATLKKCDNSIPEVLAFLAMAQHRVGQPQDARTTLEQLRQTLKTPQRAAHSEAQRFLREAEELLRQAARAAKQG